MNALAIFPLAGVFIAFIAGANFAAWQGEECWPGAFVFAVTLAAAVGLALAKAGLFAWPQIPF
jgi:hypothetical protein